MCVCWLNSAVFGNTTLSAISQSTCVQERILRVSAVKRQEWDTPTHLIKYYNSTHDGHVSIDRLVMADGTCTSVSYWLDLDIYK